MKRAKEGRTLLKIMKRKKGNWLIGCVTRERRILTTAVKGRRKGLEKKERKKQSQDHK